MTMVQSNAVHFVHGSVAGFLIPPIQTIYELAGQIA